MPERPSAQVNTTLTLVLFHPAALDAGEPLAVMVGAVLSILIVVLVEAMFPALSTAVPAAIWFAPSPFSRAGAVHVAMPERRSRQLKVTVTAELFHPKALARGVGLAEIVGTVLSRLMVTNAEAVFPARSVAVPLMT